MTDLPVEENEALEAVDHIGYLIRRFATIKDREAGEHLVRDLATIRSALAAREYSTQREEKLDPEKRVQRLVEVVIGPCSRTYADGIAIELQALMNERWPRLGAAVAVKYKVKR